MVISHMTDESPQSDLHSRPLSGDRPIEKATEDRLGYAPFAKAIAISVVKRAPSDGIVYAIHGPWGSGKTSAVNMLVEAIDEMEAAKSADDRLIVVRFNPWWFSEQSDLTKTFFSEISSTLEKKVTKKVAEGLRKVGRQVAGAKDLISGLVNLAPGGALFSPFLKDGIEAIKSHFDESESLDSARQELIEALREQGRRILVIVDDIDRLHEDEARQIFRMVKSVADLPNVVYLLVFDREVARRALGETTNVEGPEWLEKIVQASFDLPPVHPVDLRKMLVEGINELIGDRSSGDDIRTSNILFACVYPYIKTPRDVGRLLNALSVSLPAVIDDVNLADFIAIETIRTFDSKIYDIIRTRQSELVGINSSRMPRDINIGDDIMALVADIRKDKVKSSLKRLFPRLESVWSNLHYDGSSVAKWVRERRICTAQHFPTYFIFGPGEDTLREAEITAILKSLGSIDRFSQVVESLSLQKRRNGTTKASLVCDTIQTRCEDIDDSDLVKSAKTFICSGNVLYPHHDGGQGFGQLPFAWGYWWTLSSMLEKLNQKSRIDVLCHGLDRATELFTLSFVIHALEGQFGLHEGVEQRAPEERTVDEAGLKKLQDKLIDRIRRMSADGSLINQPELSNLLSRWIESDGSDVVRQWSDSLLSNDINVISLVNCTLSRGQTHADGDYVTSTFYQIDKDFARKYVDLDKLAERIMEIDAKTAGGIAVAKLFARALSRNSERTEATAEEVGSNDG